MINSSTVTASNVTFLGNQAKGGNGGGNSKGGFGGGGGGLNGGFGSHYGDNGGFGGGSNGGGGSNFVGGKGGFGGGNGGGKGEGGFGGGGGGGLGGAIFVNTGSNLTLSNSTFTNNSTIGGQGSGGGTNGQGKGGAIFVNTGATVTSIGTQNYSGNTASNAAGTSTDNNNIYGIVTTVPPKSVPEPNFLVASFAFAGLFTTRLVKKRRRRWYSGY